MSNEKDKLVKQEKPANDDTANGTLPIGAEGTVYSDPAEISLKDLIAKPEVQEAIKSLYPLPDVVIVKKLRKSFKNDDTKETTQKIKVIGGTTIKDSVDFELTLLNTELDPQKAVNREYRIADYKFALTANMSGGKFSGYAATGLKVVVTRMEEVK